MATETCHKCTQPATVRQVISTHSEYSSLPKEGYGHRLLYAKRYSHKPTVIYLCDKCTQDELEG